jgi:hypothetical protein
MSGFPDSIPRKVGGAQRVERATDRHARSDARGPLVTERVVATIQGDAGATFTVLEGALPKDGDGVHGAVAVYADSGSKAILVPTGRVLVRFAEGVVARAKVTSLAHAGYRIAALIDYAENAAWVDAADGDVAAALRGLDRLAAIAGVVSVEPQLLSARALK